MFFASDSTGITAETLGSALLANFPGAHFDRHTIPFLGSVTAVDAVTARLERATPVGEAPIVFATVKDAGIRARLAGAGAVVIDLLASRNTPFHDAWGRPAAPSRFPRAMTAAVLTRSCSSTMSSAER